MHQINRDLTEFNIKYLNAVLDVLTPVMRTGGFIPSVDHQTPPGVSLENYRTYIRLFREYAVKACG